MAKIKAHGRSPASLEALVAKIKEQPRYVELCVRAIPDVAPTMGAAIDAFASLVAWRSQQIDPIDYALSDRLLLDLEESGVPTEAVSQLRAATLESPSGRADFESRARAAVSAETWARHGDAILKTAALDRLRLECDANDTFHWIKESFEWQDCSRAAPSVVRTFRRLVLRSKVLWSDSRTASTSGNRPRKC